MTQNNSNPKNTHTRAQAQQAMGRLCTEWDALTNPLRNSAVATRAPSQPRPDDYDDTDLFTVCLHGDLPALEKLAAKGVNLHVLNEWALLIATAGGHLEITRCLVDHGADIHARNDTALQYAAANGSLEIVRYLTDQGANIHADNEVTLRLAAANGRNEIINFLLDQGADIHVNGDMPLQWAINHGQMETVDLLTARGNAIEALTAEERDVYLAFKNEKMTVLKKSIHAEPLLADIFTAATWAGHIPEMIALWNQLPEPLQTEIDFQHLLTDAKIHTLKEHKPKITFVK